MNTEPAPLSAVAVDPLVSGDVWVKGAMPPDEFARRMRVLLDNLGHDDGADMEMATTLCLEMLKQLGYESGAVLYREFEHEWYYGNR